MLKMNLQLFAHKKGMGSTKNGRESQSKRLGAKKGDGQPVLAGNILVRQRGIPAQTSESVLMIPSSLLSTVQSSMSARARIRSR